jgi:VWFA-related protein
MMRKKWQRLSLMVCLIPAGICHEVDAQTPPVPPSQKTNDQEQALRIVTNEVRLPLRALDPSGKLVTDLTPQEVVVIEDGRACPVTRLKLEPANIMIMLDLSNNLGIFKSRLEDRKTNEALFERWNYAYMYRPIAREFTEIILRQLTPHHQIAIVQYADRVEMLQDWTRDRDQAISMLRAKFRAGIKARFYDALTFAASRLHTAPAGRRVLVIVTDGLDSASAAAKQSAFEEVLATGASVYVVSWADILISEAQKTQHKRGLSLVRGGEIKRYREDADGAAEELRTLTAKSGGEYWQPAVVSEFMLQRPHALVSEIDSEYTLTYLSHKDEIDRVSSIPEIRIARPGMSALTRRAGKFKGAER